MKDIKRLILLIFVLPTWLMAVKYPIINYQTSDGLPQNQVNTLIQDQLGYIYIGTQSGIGKFDGNEFQVLTRRDGLPNNYINDFAMDKEGNIWVATIEGLAKIDKNYKIFSLLSSEYIQTLTYDNLTNILWVITKNGVFFSEANKFVKFTFPTIKKEKIDKIAPKGLIITNLGTKYFYWDHKIVELKTDTQKSIEVNQYINFVKELNEKILVGTVQGLFALEKHQLQPYLILPRENPNITDAMADDMGRIWIGTQTGLFFYNKSSEPPLLITDENGLSAKRIRKILIDREKNVFLGTEWGLSQLSPTLFKMYDETDGLPHKFAWDFEEDNNLILVSCDQGIVELNPETGQLKTFPINQKLKKYSIRTITKLKDNVFLLGTRDNGIFQWDRNDNLKKIRDIAHVTSAVSTKDDQPIVWFGTDNGLLKYDGTDFKVIQNGLKDNTVWTLDIFDRDTVYVGTGKGIQKCYKDSFVDSELEKKLGNNTTVNDIKVISPNEILIASELSGLFIYKNNELQNFTTANGLSHNDIWAIVKDDLGNIWMNTSVSLDRNSNGFVSHFNKKTGLFGEEGGIHGAFKASSGKIYFCITPGFIEIPVQGTSLDQNINKPILFIKDVRAKGTEIYFNYNNSSNINLKYNQNNIEFDYIAVSTRKENPVFYRTRLLPLENQWSEPTKETHIKYLNLAPDDYVFQVMANNGGGENQWFKSRNQITLIIAKPFWLTWWFILFSIFMIVLFVIFIIKVRLTALEKQKKNLEEQVQERTEKLKYLSITDPLTDLKNRRYLEEKIKEDISLIERFIFDSRKSPDNSSTPILGVFILDIDYFKKVNDDYGHKAGDIVIVDIARLLIDMLRHSDTIVRWGGEEFLIITWQKEKNNSFDLAERIRKQIEEYEFKVDDTTILKKTVSVGFAHFPFIPNDVHKAKWPHVVSLADSALYIAKNNGRNTSIGIECDSQIKELDTDFKDIVSDIKLGIRKKYLKIVSNKKNLVISQHKT